MKRNLITEICLALLILLYTYTGLSKLLNLETFTFQLHLAPVKFMQWSASVLGPALPAAELLIAGGLLFERSRQLSLWASLALLAVFEGYIIILLNSGLQLPCTCGGFIASLSWKQHLLFNAAFIVITIKALYDLLRVKQVVPLPVKNGL